LAAGESLALPLPGEGGCGFFLPTGADGDRYRFGVLYSKSDHNNPNDVPTVTVSMNREIGGVPGSEELLTTPLQEPETLGLGPRIRTDISSGFREGMRMARATEEFHRHIHGLEREVIRKLGPEARPLPDRRTLARAPGPALAAPEKLTFTNPPETTSTDPNVFCSVAESVPALKVLEDDHLVIYQDSAQRETAPLLDSHAQWMADFYKAHGTQVVDNYFGGVSDVNEDGKITVFVTSIPREDEGTIAYVSNLDFYPKSICPASNEMEMMRFSNQAIKELDNEVFYILTAVVHEAKHISSFYKSIFRGGGNNFQPTWVEEGTAEIATEMSSRLAWAGAGGPAVGAMATGSDLTEFTRENYGAVYLMVRTISYLSSQPNGVVVPPTGADPGHSVYDSGWHFHRWLGDAYGNAAVPQGDSAFFRTLNDSLTAAGVQGIVSVTGAPSWTSLMEEYLTAVMVNGTAAPQGPRTFSSYNFPSMTNRFSSPDPPGEYPWPVNTQGDDLTAPFATSTNVGLIGPSGVRIFDLSSNGTGLGLEVKVSTSQASLPFRIVVVRLK
jgi:hypothetical protein